jgi:hypothetical protein
MLRLVVLLITEIPEEFIASIIRVKHQEHQGETSVLTRVTLRYIPEGGILHSHRCENLKSYIALTGRALWQRRNVFPLI